MVFLSPPQKKEKKERKGESIILTSQRKFELLPVFSEMDDRIRCVKENYCVKFHS